MELLHHLMLRDHIGICYWIKEANSIWYLIFAWSVSSLLICTWKKTNCNFPEFCQILLSSWWEKKMTRTGWSELNHILILVFTNHTLPLWKYEYLPSCWFSVVVVSSTVLALTASMMIFCDWTFRNGSEAQKVHLLPCLFFISIYIHFPYTN